MSSPLPRSSSHVHHLRTQQLHSTTDVLSWIASLTRPWPAAEISTRTPPPLDVVLEYLSKHKTSPTVAARLFALLVSAGLTPHLLDSLQLFLASNAEPHLASHSTPSPASPASSTWVHAIVSATVPKHLLHPRLPFHHDPFQSLLISLSTLQVPENTRLPVTSLASALKQPPATHPYKSPHYDLIKPSTFLQTCLTHLGLAEKPLPTTTHHPPQTPTPSSAPTLSTLPLLHDRNTLVPLGRRGPLASEPSITRRQSYNPNNSGPRTPRTPRRDRSSSVPSPTIKTLPQLLPSSISPPTPRPSQADNQERVRAFREKLKNTRKTSQIIAETAVSFEPEPDTVFARNKRKADNSRKRGAGAKKRPQDREATRLQRVREKKRRATLPPSPKHTSASASDSVPEQKRQRLQNSQSSPDHPSSPPPPSNIETIDLEAAQFKTKEEIETDAEKLRVRIYEAIGGSGNHITGRMAEHIDHFSRNIDTVFTFYNQDHVSLDVSKDKTSGEKVTLTFNKNPWGWNANISGGTPRN